MLDLTKEPNVKRENRESDWSMRIGVRVSEHVKCQEPQVIHARKLKENQYLIYVESHAVF